MALASAGRRAGVSMLSPSSLDARAQRLAADAVAVVQRRQRAGVEEGVGQPGQLEARRLHAMAQQRAGHRLAQAADHRMVLGHHHQPVLVAHRLDDRRLVQRLDRRAVQHRHADIVFRQVLRCLQRPHRQQAAGDHQHVGAFAQHLGLAEFEAVALDLVEHQRHLAAQQPHVHRALVRGDLRHGLLDVERVARIDDRQPGDAAHHRDVLDGGMARSVAGGQPGQCAADLDVQVLLGDHLVNEVVGATRAECGVGGGERHQPFLGHAAGRGHQQLLGHAHLVEALGVGLREQVQVGVLRQVGGHADHLGPRGRVVHQRLAEGRRLHALPFGGDRGDHRRGGQPRLLLCDGGVHAGAPSGCM